MSSPLRDHDWPACAPGPQTTPCDGPHPAAWPHPDPRDRQEVVIDQLGRAIAHLRVAQRLQRGARIDRKRSLRSGDRARVLDQLHKAVAHLREATQVLEAAASPEDAGLVAALTRPRAWIEGELERLGA